MPTRNLISAPPSGPVSLRFSHSYALKTNSQGIIIDVSDSFASIFSSSPLTITGRHLSDFLCPDHGYTPEQISDIDNSGILFSLIHSPHKIFISYDKGGHRDGYFRWNIVYHQSFPESRQSLLESLYENVGYPVFVIEPGSGCIVFLNRSALLISGYGSIELTGSSIHSIIHTTVGDSAATTSFQAAKGSLITKENVTIPLEILKTVIGLSGKAHQVWHATPDVQQSKSETSPSRDFMHIDSLGLDSCLQDTDEMESLRAENAGLKRSCLEFNEILENATEIIFKLDKEGKFIFISAEIERSLGHKTDELLGKHFHTIIHPDDISHCDETFGTIIAFGKASGNITFRARHVNGSYRWFSCSGVFLRDHNQELRYSIGFAVDVTVLQDTVKSLKATEERYEALICTHEKERADIGKELHDNINQILSTTRLYLELARNDESERMELIKRSADNIHLAVNEIRLISRSLVPSSLNDLGLIESIDDLVENIRRTRKLNIEFRYDSEINERLDGQKKLMLFRIVQEQVNNVLRHAEARNMDIELVRNDANIRLMIADDGKGFDQNNIHHKKGVGLSNIASRAEMVNGKVSLFTEPGRGCRLNIEIPIIN